MPHSAKVCASIRSAMPTKQAEMVLAADKKPNKTKVWIYRNTIKALNWFGSVREKLDDPQYSGW